MKINIKTISLTFVILMLFSCGKPTEVKPNLKTKLAQALYLKNFNTTQSLLKSIKLSETTRSLIEANKAMHQGSEPTLQKELNDLTPSYNQMKASQQQLYNQLHQWLLLKQIYRTEIAPPVRILQREQLYLAPSHINFNVCQTTPARCASQQRTALAKIISPEKITQEIKKMALKDPCANLSNTLKNSTFANRCLDSSKGSLRIELLPKPFLTQSKWLELISNE